MLRILLYRYYPCAAGAVQLFPPKANIYSGGFRFLVQGLLTLSPQNQVLSALSIELCDSNRRLFFLFSIHFRAAKFMLYYLSMWFTRPQARSL